jgi:hypothetical protein
MRPITVRRWRAPTNWACAPSSPTATSASESCTAEPETGQGPRSIQDRESHVREMDMGFWIEKADVALKEVG